MIDLHALIGRTLGGRYRVEALLGQGGFGAVYRAVHVELGHFVAIKTLVARLGVDHQMEARFRREATVLRGLRHLSIVQLLDFGREPDGMFWMAQEYVDGRTLKDVIEENGPLDTHRAARIISDALDGLAAAHRRGIVHRDIKPANIMLVEGHDGEEVRVLDFGIAKVHDAVDESQTLTAQGQLLGTPAFMAPEQIQQEPPTAATDIYALGGVLYYLLTGSKPYSGNIQAVLTAHLVLPAPRVAPDHSHLLDPVIAKAMAKVPSDRYPDAETMQLAILQACGRRHTPTRYFAQLPSRPDVLALQQDSGSEAAATAPLFDHATAPPGHDRSAPLDRQFARFLWTWRYALIVSVILLIGTIITATVERPEDAASADGIEDSPSHVIIIGGGETLRSGDVAIVPSLDASLMSDGLPSDASTTAADIADAVQPQTENRSRRRSSPPTKGPRSLARRDGARLPGSEGSQAPSAPVLRRFDASLPLDAAISPTRIDASAPPPPLSCNSYFMQNEIEMLIQNNRCSEAARMSSDFQRCGLKLPGAIESRYELQCRLSAGGSARGSNR